MNQQIASALLRCALLYALCLSGSAPAEQGGVIGETAKDAIEAGKRFPYWFDDTGAGACRVPKSWRLLYKEGNEWKPVPDAGEFGTKADTFNTVACTLVTTDSLRMEVQSQPQFSTGILKWKVK